jgi:DNA-binding transcriptional LysR family regulator
MKDLSDALFRRLRVRHIQLIAILGQTGSVRAAAHLLHLSQPAVSKMLQETEEAFGERLFDRSRRGVSPRPAGLLAIRRAQVVLNELRSAAIELQTARDDGLLRLGTLPVIGLVPVAVVALLAEFPKARVKLTEAGVQTLIDGLLDGSLDCVCAALPASSLERVDELRVEIITEDQLCAVISPRHRLASRSSAQWSEVQALRWVSTPRTTLTRQVFDSAFIHRGMIPPTPVVETQSPLTLNTLIANDPSLIGLARIDAGRLAVRTEGLRVLGLEPTVPLPPLCILTRQDASPPAPILDAFRGHLRAAASEANGSQCPKPAQTVAMGLAGDPTAPGRRKGGAVKRKRLRA